MMNEGLIIFVRQPEPGKVKTRLAAQSSDQLALAVYLRLLEHTRKLAHAARARVHVFATEALHDDFWKGFAIEMQQGADLGSRMEHAFALLMQRGYEKVVIIGSDCPALSPAHLTEAFARLDDHDLVIGPAQDGGYYLLGMKKLHAALFRNKHWSTCTVLKETEETIAALGLSCHALPQLSDVDQLRDVPPGWLQELALILPC